MAFFAACNGKFNCFFGNFFAHQSAAAAKIAGTGKAVTAAQVAVVRNMQA